MWEIKMLNKIKTFFVNMLNAVIRSREAKAKAYVEFYKKYGYAPYYDV